MMSGKNSPRRKGKSNLDQSDADRRLPGEHTAVTFGDGLDVDVSEAKATVTMARAEMAAEESMVSADIDAILKRLDERMPQMFEDMKALRSRLRRPLAV